MLALLVTPLSSLLHRSLFCFTRRLGREEKEAYRGWLYGNEGVQFKSHHSLLSTALCALINLSVLFTVLFMEYHWEPLQRRESVLKVTIQLVVNLRSAKFVALRPLLAVEQILLASHGDTRWVSLLLSIKFTLSLSLDFPLLSVKHVSAGTTLSSSSLASCIVRCRVVAGLSPQYLSELLIEYKPTRTLRSCSKKLLVVPRVNTKRYGERAFSVIGPRLWNSLPQNLRDITNLEHFKKNLKTYLFKL